VLAEVMHETSTFSPIPTPLEAFQMGTGRTVGVRHRRGARAFRGTNTSLGGLIEVASEARAEIAIPIAGGAPPGQRPVPSCPSSPPPCPSPGPRCNIVGGGTYNTERLDMPMWKQGVKTGYSVLLEDDIWLGAAVSVLGGVRVGHGSIAGAEARAGD
jgi:hypothetical protein